MDVRNCKRCGKIYNYDGFRLCPTCRREDEEDFVKVKEYIYDHPKANISEVSEETEVDPEKIIEFLRQDRLEIAEGGNLVLECEICSVSIKSGRFCNKCKQDLEKELGRSIKPGEEVDNKRETGKFRVMDRYKGRR